MTPTYLPKDFAGINYIQDLLNIIKPIQTAFAINYFGHTRIYKDGSITGIYSNPSVPDYWVGNNYTIPGSSITGSLLESGFYFAEEIESLHTPGTLESIYKEFNIKNCIYFVDKGTSYDEHFMFSSDSCHFKTAFINSIDQIKEFLLVYYCQAKTLLDKCSKTRIILPTMRITPEVIENLCPSIVNEYQLQLSVIPKKILLYYDEENSFYITKRQFIILCLKAVGLSSKSVSDYLYISPRTVETHLQNLKKIMLKKRTSGRTTFLWQCLLKDKKLFQYFKLITAFFLNKDATNWL